jgi:hypothetical protein
VLSSIFWSLFAFNSQALTSQSTLNAIEGNAPYLTFDGGVTRVTDTKYLLGITLPDGTHITPSSNSSSPSSPIALLNPNMRFADIDMFVPVNTNSVALDTLIGPPNNFWGDDDGDGQGSGGITVTGSLNLSIVDNSGQPVARSDLLTFCKAPYKVTLESTGGTLSTRYGIPKSSRFNRSSATYYINPTASPEVCFARPSLTFGSSSEDTRFRGPANMWNQFRGFLTQSIVPSGYYKNFPTTGAHNLYFDLDIAGVNTRQLSWPSVTHSGITATMTPDSSGTSVRVELTGPYATEAQWNGDSPSSVSSIANPSLPATFELVGRDSSGRDVIKYGFKLKQWFVNLGLRYHSYSSSLSWCDSMGYQLPSVRDLTNAKCVGGAFCQGSVGASPSSSKNAYMRHIDSGFFSEWGNMYKYTNAGFLNGYFYYWTKDAQDTSRQFMVSSNNGTISRLSISNSGTFALCASSLRP